MKPADVEGSPAERPVSSVEPAAIEPAVPEGGIGARSVPVVLRPVQKLDEAAIPRPLAAAKRLASLDAFRGLAILGMLLVNNKALGPWTPAHLTHAGWNDGVHFADMVYPWFLLIVGVAIPFSSRRGLSRWGYSLRVTKRAALLVLLGCLINSSYARHPLFDLGVLQLIGLAYFAGALLYGLPMKRRVAAAAAFLAAHWAVMKFLPIPGVGAGVFTESQNAVLYLNDAFLAKFGLSNLPAVLPTTALVLIGSTIGEALRVETQSPKAKVKALVTAGVALALAGWLWNLDLPFNKRLWTAPYVLFTAGSGSVLLGALYWLMDIRKSRAWAFPLTVMGMNAITAFAAPILVNIHVLGEWGWAANGTFVSLGEMWVRSFTNRAGAGFGGLLYTLSYLMAWWLILFWMYRRRVFLKV